MRGDPPGPDKLSLSLSSFGQVARVDHPSRQWVEYFLSEQVWGSMDRFRSLAQNHFFHPRLLIVDDSSRPEE